MYHSWCVGGRANKYGTWKKERQKGQADGSEASVSTGAALVPQHRKETGASGGSNFDDTPCAEV
jgi:hypothetical protein